MTRFFRNLGKIAKKGVNPWAPVKALGRTDIGRQVKQGAKDFIKGPASDFLTGTPEERENVSTLRPEQEPLYQQAVNAGLGEGAGGAFGDSADYYRNLLSDDSEDFDSYAAPQLRQYNEDIVPGLSEQFAGMGAGGLSSSGFRNAQIQGATDLSERLGQIRANLRQAGAQGLQHAGQIGLNPYSQNMVTQPGSEGFLSQIGPAIGTGVGAYFGGIPGAMAGNQIGQVTKNAFGGNKVGANSSPYGAAPMASPQIRPLPNRTF
jgi:hypothetical protein